MAAGDWTERELTIGDLALWKRERREAGLGSQLAAVWSKLPPPDQLYSRLQLVYRVGPWREARLRRQGFADLRALGCDPVWRDAALPVLQAIESRNLPELAARGANPLDLLSLLRPEDILFLDLETTGLSAVMPVFLVGVASVDGDTLWVRQYFARSYEEEEALIQAVSPLLSHYPVVMTYNGRSFDQPYLVRRSLITQSPLTWTAWHVDLLPLTRRHFRTELPDCRLCTVSECLLGRSRADDIPGSLVPSLYHQFVEEGDWLVIEPVLTHNSEDLVSLALLLERLVEETTQSTSTTVAGARTGIGDWYEERTGTA